MCRICKGEHFTSKCPYKDTLQPLDEIANSIENVKNEGKENIGLGFSHAYKKSKLHI